MHFFSLSEYETKEFDTPAAAAFGSAIAGSGLAQPSLAMDGRLRLTAGSKVGVLQFRCGGETVQVRVEPKLPIGRLFWMLSHAGDERGWREEHADLAAEQDFVPALAVAFTTAASRALAPGVLQGYRVAEESLPALRGRLREADQLRRRVGMPLPLEIRYDDYSVDIPENQILRAAVDRLRRSPGLPQRARRGLHRLAHAFADVTKLIPGAALPPTTPHRLNARYRPALRLARLVLAGHGIEHQSGAVQATGFTVDMNKVFEQWLTAVLREAITTHYGGTVTAQHQAHLDEHAQVEIRPDITWWQQHRCLAVVDAKYKKNDGASPPNADLYQALAYCTALGLRVGHLVYATDHEPRREHRLTGSGVRVVAHGLNLAAPLDTLRREITCLADEVAGGARH